MLDSVALSTRDRNFSLLSPVLQTLVHDVSFVGRLQVVSPGQKHCRWADGADHQVEWFLQVHLTCVHTGEHRMRLPVSLEQEVKPNQEAVSVPVQCFFTSLAGIGWTATRYLGSASETTCGFSSLLSLV